MIEITIMEYIIYADCRTAKKNYNSCFGSDHLRPNEAESVGQFCKTNESLKLFVLTGLLSGENINHIWSSCLACDAEVVMASIKRVHIFPIVMEDPGIKWQ